MKEIIDGIFCVFLGDYRWFRKLRGGMWVRFLDEKCFSGDFYWAWLPADWFLCPLEELRISQTEDYRGEKREEK